MPQSWLIFKTYRVTRAYGKMRGGYKRKSHIYQTTYTDIGTSIHANRHVKASLILFSLNHLNEGFAVYTTSPPQLQSSISLPFPFNHVRVSTTYPYPKNLQKKVKIWKPHKKRPISLSLWVLPTSFFIIHLHCPVNMSFQLRSAPPVVTKKENQRQKNKGKSRTPPKKDQQRKALNQIHPNSNPSPLTGKDLPAQNALSATSAKPWHDVSSVSRTSSWEINKASPSLSIRTFSRRSWNILTSMVPLARKW